MSNVRAANALAVTLLREDYKSDWGFTQVYNEAVGVIWKLIQEGYRASKRHLSSLGA